MNQNTSDRSDSETGSCQCSEQVRARLTGVKKRLMWLGAYAEAMFGNLDLAEKCIKTRSITLKTSKNVDRLFRMAHVSLLWQILGGCLG